MSMSDDFEKRNLLTDLKDLQFMVNQVPSDSVSGLPGNWLNRAKNLLSKMVIHGEKREEEKLRNALEINEAMGRSAEDTREAFQTQGPDT